MVIPASDCFGGLSNRIGHDPFDGDAEASVIGEGGFQVGEGAACFLIGEDAYREAGGSAASETSGRIDAHMQGLPALVRQAHQPTPQVLDGSAGSPTTGRFYHP